MVLFVCVSWLNLFGFDMLIVLISLWFFLLKCFTLLVIWLIAEFAV